MRTALLALTVLTCTSAWAGPRSDRVTGWVTEAEQLYLAGKYHQAAELLLKAQAEEPNPRLVYDIARAFEKAGELEEAQDYYQAYLRGKSGTDAACWSRGPRSPWRASEPFWRMRNSCAGSDRSPRRHWSSAASASSLEARERSAVEASRQNRDTALWQAWALGGLSVVTLGTGITFAVSAGRAKDQFNHATTVPSKQAWSNTTSLRAGLADASFVVAVAAGVAAFSVYPKGRPVTASVGPLVLEGGGGFLAQVRY